MPDLAGLVLAAGAGTRRGGPKALARSGDGEPWLVRACATLAAGGCTDVSVVLGAGATEARELVPPGVHVVVADDWDAGQSASLAAGLRALLGTSHEAVVVTLVDLPDQQASAVARVAEGATAASLRRATYAGRPGHPVVLGRDHWTSVLARLSGDEGARRYLHDHGAQAVDCTDLGGGEDADE